MITKGGYSRMTEDFTHTRRSWEKLKAALLDFHQRTMILLHAASLLVMAAAACLAFGWPGALFCFGLFLWWVSRPGD